MLVNGNTDTLGTAWTEVRSPLIYPSQDSTIRRTYYLFFPTITIISKTGAMKSSGNNRWASTARMSWSLQSFALLPFPPGWTTIYATSFWPSGHVRPPAPGCEGSIKNPDKVFWMNWISLQPFLGMSDSYTIILQQM